MLFIIIPIKDFLTMMGLLYLFYHQRSKELNTKVSRPISNDGEIHESVVTEQVRVLLKGNTGVYSKRNPSDGVVISNNQSWQVIGESRSHVSLNQEELLKQSTSELLGKSNEVVHQSTMGAGRILGKVNLIAK